MNSLFKILNSNTKCVIHSNFVLFSTNTCYRQMHRPMLRTRKKSFSGRIEPYGWFMLIIPAASFGLGVWQVQRKGWKEQLIAEMSDHTGSAPIPLPESLDEIKKLEFHPVHVRGTFLHDKEMYMGPRQLIDREEPSMPKPVFGDTSAVQGYLVVTPFKLADRDQTILVNRGWVTANRIKPKMRPEGQIEGVVDVIGILRNNENRPTFAVKNKEGSHLFFYRELESMCEASGASPVFLDQTLDHNVPGGPIGGQTRVTLRNEHMSYIITWFSLSAITGYMWFTKFVMK